MLYSIIFEIRLCRRLTAPCEKTNSFIGALTALPDGWLRCVVCRRTSRVREPLAVDTASIARASPSQAMAAAGAGAAARRAAAVPLSRPLPTATSRTVSHSAFALLYSEMITYYQPRATSRADLEVKLKAAGYNVGIRLCELVGLRERPGVRDVTVLSALAVLRDIFWPHVFGKKADGVTGVDGETNACACSRMRRFTPVSFPLPPFATVVPCLLPPQTTSLMTRQSPMPSSRSQQSTAPSTLPPTSPVL